MLASLLASSIKCLSLREMHQNRLLTPLLRMNYLLLKLNMISFYSRPHSFGILLVLVFDLIDSGGSDGKHDQRLCQRPTAG